VRFDAPPPATPVEKLDAPENVREIMDIVRT
jgi:hypothetical protein